MKFPTMDEFAQMVADKVLDEYEYKGKTLRQWVEIISAIPVTAIPATDNNVGTKLGTNLAEVGTDCISRQDALEAFGLSEKTRKYGGDHSGYDTMMMYEIQDTIEDLPPIQPKRGRWIYCEDSTADCVDGYRCDQCGFFVPWDYKHKGIDFIQDYNFCQNCGADMRQREE